MSHPSVPIFLTGSLERKRRDKDGPGSGLSPPPPPAVGVICGGEKGDRRKPPSYYYPAQPKTLSILPFSESQQRHELMRVHYACAEYIFKGEKNETDKYQETSVSLPLPLPPRGLRSSVRPAILSAAGVMTRDILRANAWPFPFSFVCALHRLGILLVIKFFGFLDLPGVLRAVNIVVTGEVVFHAPRAGVGVGD